MKKYRIVEGSKRLIIFLPFLKEGLEFAQKYQYNEIVITSQPSDSLFGEKYTLDTVSYTHLTLPTNREV